MNWSNRLSAGILLALSLCVSGAWAAECPALLNRTFPRLQDDQPQSLCQFSGKVILVVNTASYCGFTSQYEGLEKLYAGLKDRGFVVLGFPSNDFSQEPGTNQEVAQFCTNTYSVKFPMFAKSQVKGPQANPLFQDLARAQGAPNWNFHKYLIGRDGRIISSYASMTGPGSSRIARDIEQALGPK